MKLFSWGITTREIAIKQKTQHGSINFALKGLSFYDQGLHLKYCTRMAGPGGGGWGVWGPLANLTYFVFQHLEI